MMWSRPWERIALLVLIVIAATFSPASTLSWHPLLEFYVVEPETVAMTDVLRHPFSLPDEPSHSGPQGIVTALST